MATKGCEKERILELFESQKESWQKRASEGIEKHRKGNATLTLTDLQGRAVSGARVKIRQTSHEFRFGANLFMLDELESAEKNALYKQYFSSVFNLEKIRQTQGDMTVGENYYHGALIRFDMTPKPSYQRLKEMISHCWHTEESRVTDENGTAEYRGFYGTYALEIEANGKSYCKEAVLSSKTDNGLAFILDT